MNRQTKRMLQRQGQVGPDGGAPAPPKRQAGPGRPGGPGGPGRGGPPRTGGGGGAIGRGGQFIREVRGELRRVAWPSRAEVANYSTVVLMTLIVLVAVIFVLDYAMAKGVLFLFESPK